MSKRQRLRHLAASLRGAPPPAWRHWLPLMGIIGALFLWTYVPAVHRTP